MTRRENKQQRYEESINQLPLTRGGGMYNSHIASVTAHGIQLGYNVDQIKHDISAMGRGVFKVNEIENAYKSSLNLGISAWDFDKAYTRPAVNPFKREEKSIEIKYKPFHRAGAMMDLIEESPIRLLNDPYSDAHTLLDVLYNEDDILFIGDTYDTEVKTVRTWLNDDNLTSYPFIVPNTFTGLKGTTTTGKESYRCEATIKECRYVVVEMDETPIDEQVCFWLDAIHKLPVACVIHSGSKSLHGWLKIDCPLDDWEAKIKNKLFAEMLVPMGADRSCSNKARLSRLPGHYRQGKEQQRLLYLNGDV